MLEGEELDIAARHSRCTAVFSHDAEHTECLFINRDDIMECFGMWPEGLAFWQEHARAPG